MTQVEVFLKWGMKFSRPEMDSTEGGESGFCPLRR